MSLHKAVLKGDFLEVRRLVESGVEVNRRDAGGRTALMLCCLHDGEDRARGVARTLLMHGGRVGLSDGSGRSALIYAVLYERVGLVRMFLQALDYDLTAHDRTGGTTLDYANQTRNRTIMDLVLQVMRRYGLTSQNSCTQNPQTTDQKIQEPQEPQHQPSTKALLKTKDSKTEVPSGDESSLSIQNPEPGPNSVFRNPLPYRTLPKKLWKIKENVHQRKHQGPQTVSKSTSSKKETESGEESSTSAGNPEPDQYGVFTNPLPYKTLSEKKRMSQETIERTLGPKRQPASKDAPKKDTSKQELSPPVQNPEPGQYGEFTTRLPYRTLSKNLWKSRETIQRTLAVQHQTNPKLMSKVQGFPHIQNPEPGQETVQRKLEPQHQPAFRGASKVAFKVVLEKVQDKTEIKSGDESSPSVQNPEPDMSKNLQPRTTTSKNINRESLQRNLEPKDLQRSVNANERTTHGRSPPLTPRNWRLDFRVLMETLQVQNSPSYRPKAQPRPPAPRRRWRRFPGAERSPVLGRKKSRKMSLGVLDESLQVEKMMRTCRRRCTLAAIPVIRPTKGRSTRVTAQENFRMGGEQKPRKTAGEINLYKMK
ncbi:ankyrin repeat domain-containing protein 34C-like [Astyanax mexicanus]|uniref:Ankyrin repeat domain-containing protein 34C-like n=1 Tax=Astyanax mexicanus TaxID=7994 RepID=A0A8T2M131_ASTMX|nr:ankyrin repeat domain-containing protein 34C-like [Astyanax mexicanus]